MKGMLKSQEASTKRCDCGRGTVFTGANAKHSPVVNKRRVCEECFLDSLYEKYRLDNDSDT